MSSNSRHNDRRYSSKSRDRDSSRRSSLSSSKGRSPSPPVRPPRKENELPTEFGRPPQSMTKEDENTLLKRMESAFTNSPLSVLNDCVEKSKKIQVMVRNAKEMRGILTGRLIVFDKHWNMVLADVEEIYVKTKYLKTPFLESTTSVDLPELKRKNRQKGKKEKVLEGGAKKPAVEEAAKEEASKKAAEEEAPKKAANKAAAKKNGNKKEKPPREVLKRKWNLVLLRGDNVVSFSPFEKERTFIPPK